MEYNHIDAENRFWNELQAFKCGAYTCIQKAETSNFLESTKHGGDYCYDDYAKRIIGSWRSSRLLSCGSTPVDLFCDKSCVEDDQRQKKHFFLLEKGLK